MDEDEKSNLLKEILTNLDFSSRSKEFLRQLMQHLEMEESKTLDRVVLIQRIMQIYQTCR